MPTTYELLKTAVQSRLTVTATYDDHHRVMCPHVVGTKKGRQKALCYQFDGTSARGLGPDGSHSNWRCIFIDELTDVELQAGPWHSAGNFLAYTQTCVDNVDVAVELAGPVRSLRLPRRRRR